MASYKAPSYGFPSNGGDTQPVEEASPKPRATYLGEVDGAHRWAYPRTSMLVRTESYRPVTPTGEVLPQVKSPLRFISDFT